MEKTINKILYYLIWLLALTPCCYWLQNLNTYLIPRGYIAKILIEIIFLLYLILVSKNKEYRPKWNAINISFLIFVAISLISGIQGVDPGHSFWGSPERFQSNFDLIHWLIMLFILPCIFNTKEKWINFLKPLTTVYLGISSAFYVCYAFNFFSLHTLNVEVGRWVGFIGNSIFMAVFLLVNIFLSLYLFFEDVEKEKKNYLFLIFSLIYTFLLFQTVCRGAILSFLMCMSILLLAFCFISYDKLNKLYHIKSKKIAQVILIGILVSMITALIFRNSPIPKKIPIIKRLFSISFNDISTANRISIIKSGLSAFKQKPILGFGANNFDVAYQNNFNPEIVKVSPVEFRFDKAHNMYLEIAVTTGVIGLISYLYFFYTGYIGIKKLPKDIMSFFPKITLVLLIVSYIAQNLFIFDVFEGFMVLIIVFSFLSTLQNKERDNKFNNHKIWFLPLLLIPITLYSLYSFNFKEIAFINGNHQSNSFIYEVLMFRDIDAISKLKYPYYDNQAKWIQRFNAYLSQQIMTHPTRWRFYIAKFSLYLAQAQTMENHKVPKEWVWEATSLYTEAVKNHIVLPDIEKLYLKILKYSDNKEDIALYKEDLARLVKLYPNISWEK